MEAESFFARWSKRKQEARQQDAPPPALTAVPAPAEAAPLPTLEDAAKLTPASDFKPFLARGVDEAVKRSAMKKLFSDPHFNVMDGLDVYIDDYSKFEPIPPEMLAALNHAKALLDPLAQFEHPLQTLLETPTEEVAPDDTLATNDTPQPDPDQTPHDDPI